MSTFSILPQSPTEANEYHDLIEGAFASCWVRSHDAESVQAEAEFHISKYDWKVEKLESFPIETTKNHFAEDDSGFNPYGEAQEKGLAIIYSAWSRDGKTTSGPMPLRPSYTFNLSEYLKKQKHLKRKGRCLHYDDGQRCNRAINAHSIQKSQSLSAISENGFVYKLSSDIGSLKNNRGSLTYKKCGVNRVSTFLGFCEKHDSELFSPIDKSPLLPTDQQVILYAYRSLCRELFVKENSLDLYKSVLQTIPDAHELKKHFVSLKIGTEFGLSNLREHKSAYDNSLRGKTFNDIRYVYFISKQEPFIVFSGLFYPDVDFIGRELQNLGDHKKKLDLITFCTAPFGSNWGVLFAWHHSSSGVCIDFMRSLATSVHEGDRIGDLIFRLVVSNCENLAISPEWWESLPDHYKDQIVARTTVMVDAFSAVKPNYLSTGLEGIAPWNFEQVISKMD